MNLCECGCGKECGNRFVNGHNTRVDGPHCWKGGDSNYWAVKLKNKYKDCSFCKSTKHIIVHHKDGIRKNNERSNLIVICRKCHYFWHNY